MSKTSYDNLEKQIDDRHPELTHGSSRLKKPNELQAYHKYYQTGKEHICKGNDFLTRVAVNKLKKLGRYCNRGLNDPKKCDLTAWRGNSISQRKKKVVQSFRIILCLNT